MTPLDDGFPAGRNFPTSLTLNVMEQTNIPPLVSPLLQDHYGWKDSTFTLLDIGGCGDHHFWKEIFGPHLRIQGIEARRSKVERLNQTNPRGPFAGYHHYRAGLTEDHPFILRRGVRSAVDPRVYEQTSSAHAAQIIQMAANPCFTRKPEPESQTPPIGVDEFVELQGNTDIHFMNLEIGEAGFDVLISAQRLLKSKPFLGVSMRVNFHGGAYETDHSFGNTDRYLKQAGYELFALTVHLYSRMALPARFRGNSLGRTVSGIPLQGNAVYVKQAVMKERAVSETDLLRSLGVFDLLGLRDCLAHLLILNEERWGEAFPIRFLLNCITPEDKEGRKDYDQYLRSFSHDPHSFFRSSYPYRD